jgi:CRP-like cAMP-binding protein
MRRLAGTRQPRAPDDNGIGTSIHAPDYAKRHAMLANAHNGAGPNAIFELMEAGQSNASHPLDNRLLAAIPRSVQDRLLPKLKRLTLPLGKIIYESGDTMRDVIFPTNCIISLLYVMENGASAEISVVGNEGVVGIALFMGGHSTTSRALVQSSGHAYALPSSQMQDEFNHPDGELRLLMLRYTQALITQMAQTAVCNRHHLIDQQLCRWILLSLDRLSSNELNMTQELIANMLGVRREGVTEAAGKLQRLGIIEYHRGRIRVLDRTKLERMACECYAVVKKETDRLLAPIFSARRSSGASMA